MTVEESPERIRFLTQAFMNYLPDSNCLHEAFWKTNSQNDLQIILDN